MNSFDIEKIKRKMLIKYPFFGSITASVALIEDNNMIDYNNNPTLGTDGEQICYNPNCLNNLIDDEQTFIFSHEVCHIAFNHIIRSEGKNKKLWNIATDAVINAFLSKDGLKIVQGGVNMADAINYDVEELYDKLLKEQDQQNSQNGNDKNKEQNTSNGQNGEQDQNENQEQKSSNDQNGQQSDSLEQNESSSSIQDVGHDTHSMWEEAVKKHKDGNKQPEDLDNESKKEGTQEKEQKNKQEKLRQEKIDEVSKMGEKQAFKKNKQDRKRQLEELRDALSKEATGAGMTTNSEQRRIDDIGHAKPLIDWRRVLKEAIKVEMDWSYKNAEVEDGFVRPYLEGISQPETEIVLDTSGSINQILLKNFLRECKNILQTSKVKVGCFDTEFYGFQEIKTEKDIDNMNFVGGGGTNFNTAVNAFSKRVENKIIFTDGDADMPDITMDAIWIVFGKKKINPKGGKVIHITEEQLGKLYFSFEQEQTNINKTR